MKIKFILFMMLIGSTILLSTTASAESSMSVQDAMRAAGKATFMHRCRACHSLDPAVNSFGPSLVGVVGRPAGTLARYVYSNAMQKSKLVWTEENIRKWVENNEKLVPNTRMRHVAITDVAEQDFLIAFIKSLK
ncbi:MAG: c-type cytochrome [Gammaproteobacteria bacterium]|nr:c-type cytochrome [Gammaproteobacteria bacterium]